VPTKQSRSGRAYQQKRPAKKIRPPQKERGRRPATEARSFKDRPLHDRRPAAVSFAGLLRPLIPEPVGPQDTVTLQSAPLAHLDYSEELRLKNQALNMFWKHFRLLGQPEPIIGSPRPRHYRTTSKRKTVLKGNTLFLLFNDRALSTQRKPFIESPLEPPEHGRIFQFLQQKMSEPVYTLAAAHLNYLIIRGSYIERAVIFNVDTLNGPLVRKLKLLAGHLQKMSEPIHSASIYPDPSCSDYYLEGEQPANILHFKKLFGKTDLCISHRGFRYTYHPTSFSQVNEAMVPVMLDMAQELLKPGPAETLLDLYCGYGLFSHFLAPGYKRVLGIDAEGPSIRSAIFNKKFNPASKNARFLAQRITAKSVENIPLSDDLGVETILLDPPRQGPQEGVIKALSQREPRKVLHIYCGVDQIFGSLRQWMKHGYKIKRIVPLDMFPGTAGLEVMILLEKGRF